MTPFEHLGVLVSIVIGLGIAHLLSALHRVVEARDRVRGSWLVWLWAAVVFVAQVEWWWAFFELRHATTWNRFYFPFFGMVAAWPLLDAVRRAVQAGSWTDFGTVSNAVSAVPLTSLAVSRRPALHATVSVAVVSLFVFFIISSALQLR